MILNPAHLTLVSLHFQEAPAVFDHLQPLSVDDFGDAVADRGHPVPQIGAAGPDIDVFVRMVGDKPPAALEQQESEQ